jgi:hypothetical protein
MGAATILYPWYSSILADDLEQGDIIEDCPVFIPPDDFEEAKATEFKYATRDLIILSQSCDLVKGREKVDEILLCAVWKRSILKDRPNFATDNNLMEDARKGRMPNFHVLASCALENHPVEVRIVDFRRVHSLPVSFVRKRVAASKRIRLLPPYREHLSQAFARTFMRVGLPVDIPPFA